MVRFTLALLLIGCGGGTGQPIDGPPSDVPQPDGSLDAAGTDAPDGGPAATGSWIWDTPLPHNIFFGLWAASPTDVWALGGAGTILHWNGSAWSPVPSGVREILLGIWGAAADDVWAVGSDGVILRHVP